MGISTVSREEVLHLARLAGLRVEPAEVAELADLLTRLLEWGLALPEGSPDGDTTDRVAPPRRDDQPLPGLSTEQALAAAPRSHDDLFIVPPVIRRGSS
ncbi:MAG TPA: aspartyl/glutamyl-tRNA amidotransferase subunit C [Acidobacteria bacterium]|nr:aspartyl/glutamyl-tRNA amidotransferase subunit C [Acidobacteriota bacterium]